LASSNSNALGLDVSTGSGEQNGGRPSRRRTGDAAVGVSGEGAAWYDTR
jgi:hypothetical protein